MTTNNELQETLETKREMESVEKGLEEIKSLCESFKDEISGENSLERVIGLHQSIQSKMTIVLDDVIESRGSADKLALLRRLMHQN